MALFARVFNNEKRPETPCNFLIGHVNGYRTMHYFGIPRHTQSMMAYMILIFE